MATQVEIPGLGESVSEATIANWTKGDGEFVKADDTIAELETDKATVELPAGNDGVLKILKPKGATVAVGEVVAEIAAGQAPAKEAAAQKPSALPGDRTVQPGGRTEQAALTRNNPPAEPGALPGDASNASLSPAVRRLVDENNLNPTDIPASGREGRLTKADVLDYLAKTGASQPVDSAAAAVSQRSRFTNGQQPEMARGTTTQWTHPRAEPAPTAAAPASASPRVMAEEGDERVEMSKLRQTIARRLVEAQHTTASLTTFNEIDMSAVMDLRAKYKDQFEKAHGIGLGFMSFFAKAVVHALRAVPAVNAGIDGTALVYRKSVHLGIAVSTDRGLMVPVIRHADQLSMAEIESEIKRLATKARDGKITVDDMAGGTFTLTNGGVFGSLLSTPILNPPQSGILGMHKIEKRAVVVAEGGKDTIAIRPMMYVALTYDHRVIDGKQSVTFLVKVKEAIEDPTRILMAV